MQAALHWSIGESTQVPLHFSESDKGTLLLEGRASGTDIRVRIEPNAETYGIDYRLEVKTVDYQIDIGELDSQQIHKSPHKSGLWHRAAAVVNGICHGSDGIDRQGTSDLEDGPFEAPAAIRIGQRSDRQYFVIASLVEKQAICRVEGDESKIVVTHTFPQEKLAAGGVWTRHIQLFAGPKRDQAIDAVSPILEDLIDYTIMGIPLGFLARPMIYLLNVFHTWTTSWGLAIMLLTLLVKGLLLPVSYKAAVSMRRMQLLKPELDKIKTRWADDAQRQQMEQIKVFRETGVNPFGGCLVMFLQMPVWFALYRALWTAVDLYQQPFLWLTDLTTKEPGFPVLAVMLGGMTYLQQWLTPMTADNQQAKVMRWVMPGMFVFIMVGLPSGLVLYIFVNSVLTMVQQMFINKRVNTLGQSNVEKTPPSHLRVDRNKTAKRTALSSEGRRS
ncbi:MAG: YidC/Oxa1 family insertase periplasmic-domain containing protein [Myxococcota bacterium]